MKTISMDHVTELETERGLDGELVAKLGLWTEPAPSAGGKDALAIPFWRGEEIVNVKYRTGLVPGGDKGRVWQMKGGIQCFWNENVLRDDTLRDAPLIITEGEFDAMAAIQSGLLRTVSVPAGAPDQSVPLEHEGPKYDFLKQVKDLLGVEKVKEIILAVDGDEKGSYLLHDLALRLGKFRCKFVVFPWANKQKTHRLKDLNDVLLAYGTEGVRKVIDRAQWMRVDGIYRMSELPPPPPTQSFHCGIDGLDLRVRLGDFWVATGIPSHGKTSFVNDLCCRLVSQNKLGVAFASFEQSPQRDHRRNLRTWYNRKLVMHQNEWELEEADKWIDKQFSFIVPGDDADVTLDWVLDRCEAAVIQHGVRVVVIDPWNEMDHARAHGESLTEYTGRAIKAFKRFAAKFGVLLIVVAHPAKMQRDKDGQYSIPSLYDISDSAHWYNKADAGLVIHRVDTHSIIRVAKSRYHDEIGPPGEVRTTFTPDDRRYRVWAEHDTSDV